MEKYSDAFAKLLPHFLVVTLKIVGAVFWPAKSGLEGVNIIYL